MPSGWRTTKQQQQQHWINNKMGGGGGGGGGCVSVCVTLGMGLDYTNSVASLTLAVAVLLHTVCGG